MNDKKRRALAEIDRPGEEFVSMQADEDIYWAEPEQDGIIAYTPVPLYNTTDQLFNLIEKKWPGEIVTIIAHDTLSKAVYIGEMPDEIPVHRFRNNRIDAAAVAIIERSRG